MKRFSAVSAIILIIAWTTIAQAYTWYSYGGYNYALTNDWGTWSQAEQEAVNAGGHLVTIDSIGENEWLNATFAGTYSRDSQNNNPWLSAAWIGLYLDSSTWKWASTNSQADFMMNVPFSTGIHAYIHLSPHPWAYTGGYQWNNGPDPHDQLNSWGNFKGIIEISNSVPEPATMLLLGLGLVGIAGFRKRMR